MGLFSNVKIQDSSNLPAAKPPWVVLIVDDDEQIHRITKLALTGFKFQDRELKLISAYSGAEARTIVNEHKDIALALVDVVMEREQAGLELIRFIRQDLQNKKIRLALRTGQAGRAPEETVIQEYEIDDYREKTELTNQKLRTLLYSKLRSYAGLCTISDQKEGLNKVITASTQIQSATTFKDYSTQVLQQLRAQLDINATAFYCIVSQDHDGSEIGALTITSTSERFELFPTVSIDKLPVHVAQRYQDNFDSNGMIQYSDACLYCSSGKGLYSAAIYIEFSGDLTELNKQLLDVFIGNIAQTFENLNLFRGLHETSKELVFNLANAVEARSKETGSHVQRVAECSGLLAKYYGLSDKDVFEIKYASPLHDIGKIGIPDGILHKPGKLTPEEWQEMQRHVEYGVNILGKSVRPLLKVAAEIAGTHHEKWDGSGYPNQLAGKDIPISGRITALADVFDALGSKRSYKNAWSEADIKAELESQKGRHFDPELVDILIEHWTEFVAVRLMFPD